MSSPPSGFSVHGSAKAPVYVNPEAKEGGSSGNPNVQNAPLPLSPMNPEAKEGGSSGNPNVQNAPLPLSPMNPEAKEGGSSGNPNVQNAPLPLSPMIGNAVKYFPDVFETYNSADPSLDFGYVPNPTPIKVTSNVDVPPIMDGHQHPSTHALCKIQSSLRNMSTMAPLVAQSAKNLLLESGQSLPTDTWYGHQFITDVQILQRNICIFNDAVGVINSHDVVITNVSEMQVLVRLKIAGLWNEGVIMDGLSSDFSEMSKLAVENKIPVRVI